MEEGIVFSRIRITREVPKISRFRSFAPLRVNTSTRLSALNRDRARTRASVANPCIERGGEGEPVSRPRGEP